MVVTGVSSVATTTGGSSGDSSQGSSGGGNGGNGGSPDSVPVTVRLIHPASEGNLDQAPVTVNIISGQARNVLAVPVSALVALAGGGYAVEVEHGTGASATRLLVAVQVGLFSDTLVQVSGTGITAGAEVEVPSS